MYAVSRFRAALNAWCWTVHLRRRGKLYYRRFYDLKFGGSKRARAAAITWRDRVMAAEKVFTHLEFHRQRRSNNTSGVPGVHFLKSPRQPRGYWQARIRLFDGRKVHRSFSVLRFGGREAFRRAVAARKELLALVEDRPFLYNTIAKKFAARIS